MPSRSSKGAVAPLLKPLSVAALFQGLPEDTLKAVLARCSRRKLPEKTVLFHEADPGHALFVILKGRVVVERVGPEGEKLFLAERKAGDHVGEMALVDEAARMATVSTVTDCDFLVLRREDFHELLRDEPTVALQIIRSLTLRLREANDRAFQRENLDVTGRVAAYLLEQTQAENHDGDGPHLFPLLSDRAIADRLGVARESVARRWERLRGLGAARREGRDVVIVSVRRLKKIIGSGGGQ